MSRTSMWIADNLVYNRVKKLENVGESTVDKINYDKTFKERLNIISDNLLANNFFQLIKENTRTHTILDHIFYNNMNKLLKANVQHDSSTDHKFIILEKNESKCSRRKILFFEKHERSRF